MKMVFLIQNFDLPSYKFAGIRIFPLLSSRINKNSKFSPQTNVEHTIYGDARYFNNK
jgi:hypothetical protein